jgi:hypothetical protein
LEAIIFAASCVSDEREREQWLPPGDVWLAKNPGSHQQRRLEARGGAEREREKIADFVGGKGVRRLM